MFSKQGPSTKEKKKRQRGKRGKKICQDKVVNCADEMELSDTIPNSTEIFATAKHTKGHQEKKRSHLSNTSTGPAVEGKKQLCGDPMLR